MRNQNPVLKEESECRLENHSPVSVVESNDYYPFLYGTDFQGMFFQLNPFLLIGFICFKYTCLIVVELKLNICCNAIFTALLPNSSSLVKEKGSKT